MFRGGSRAADAAGRAEAHVHVVFPQDPIAQMLVERMSTRRVPEGDLGIDVDGQCRPQNQCPRPPAAKRADRAIPGHAYCARGRVSLPSGAAQTSAADAMMIKCDDIVRERDIASVCAIEFVQTGLFYACLAGRLDKYDALSVFLVCADCF